MKKKKKKVAVKIDNSAVESSVPSQFPPLPVPQKEEKRLMQAEVNLDLFTAVYNEMERRDLKIRQVMEFGLKAFLLATNKVEAERLGIKVEMP